MSARRQPTPPTGGAGGGGNVGTAAGSVESESHDIADRGGNALSAAGGLTGPPTGITCPECGGALWERNEQGLVMYRCHVGHSHTAETTAAQRDEVLEQTLWESMRLFEENAGILRRMADRAREKTPELAQRYAARAARAQSRTEVIRRIVLGEGVPDASRQAG